MIALVFIGFLAGVITSISPCVLPVLPVVLTSGANKPMDGLAEPADGAEKPKRRWSWRPYGVILGLIISFSLSTLFGAVVLSALHLPENLLRIAGIVMLVVIGVALIWTWFGELLERPFAKLPQRQVDPNSNGIVLGLGLGLLFVPCAGPVLATIVIVGTTHQLSFNAFILTVAFAIGCGVPLLILAIAGEAITRRTGIVRRHARRFRVTAGVLMIVVALAIGFNLTDALQRDVPGYTTALQNLVEGNKGASTDLRQLTAGNKNSPGNAAAAGNATCSEDGTSLENCGTAPDFTGISAWLNTPGGKPLSLAALRGKVVLVDFWTYSCINCQRSLPHVEAWYSSYAKDGFVVVGVHTPEFAFEHVVSNVMNQAAALGVKYPVAVDNDYGTWQAYGNQYWPAEYLIDPSGVIRHVDFGEGGYSTTEELIRELLTEHDPTVSLPKATDVPDLTPTENQTAETYLGYNYAPLHQSGTALPPDSTETVALPNPVDQDTFALGGSWTSQVEDMSAGANATLDMRFDADDVYLVIGGNGTVDVRLNGKLTKTLDIAGVPKLYTLVSGQSSQSGLLSLSVGQGVQAYDFTFG